MKCIVTGGAGFIGRWLVKKLLDRGDDIYIMDDLSNGQEANIAEFSGHTGLKDMVVADIRNEAAVNALFAVKPDACYHLAARINVQDSIDDPRDTFESDVIGTFNVLQAAREAQSRLLFMSTCMVYDRCTDEGGITEKHPVKPASPYAAAKLAGEHMVISYYHAYGMPTCVVRPFNTYGPFQKSTGEGGVIAIFIKRDLAGEDLNIYGEGTQTRDFLYVEDCADFLLAAMDSDAALGATVNAGLGYDIAVNDLARLLCNDPERIRHVPHIHPQAEIQKLLCNATLAQELLGWTPRHSLEEGLAKTREWIAQES